MGRTEIEKRRVAVRERVRRSRTAAKEGIGQAERIEGTLATTNDNTILPGNLQTPGTIVTLGFRQPKKSNSRRKRERLLADRRRKAVEKLQDANKNLKRKLKGFTSNFRERIKRTRPYPQQQHLYLFHLYRDLSPNPLHSRIKVKKHLVPKPYGITFKPDTVRDGVMVLAANPND